MIMRKKAEEKGSPAAVEIGEDILRVQEGFWGDNLENKTDNLRIMYNNVDGVKIGDFIRMRINDKIKKKKKLMLKEKRSAEKLTGILATLRNWNANILCLAETQCAWENHVCRNNVESELRKIDGYAGMIGSSSCTACCNVYKPGGTLTVYDGSWAGRITKGVDTNKLGRWSFVTIEGRNSTYLTIVTAYRCCKGQSNQTTGMASSFCQQESILKARGIRKSPQTAFIDDLESFVEKKMKDGHEILLNIDANEEWDENRSEIRRLAQRLDLYDIAKEMHPEGVPPTYTRKNVKRRIDFMLGSKQVLQNVSAFGMAPESYEKMLGDHRAQYVDLNVKQLLHLNIHDVGSPTSRRLRSQDPKCIEQYCKKVEKHFKNHNVFERMEELWNITKEHATLSPYHMKLYEAIDRDVHRLCTNAEQSIGHKGPVRYVWSPELDDAMKTIRYWSTRKKYLTDMVKTENLVANGLVSGFIDDKHKSVDDIVSEIQLAYSVLHKVQAKDGEKRQEFLSRLADKYAQDNNISKEKAIRELMSHEEVKELFRTIRLRMKGARSPQLSEVWTQDDNGEKVILNESAEVEEHLLSRNWKHLRQASNTPFADGEFGALIQWDGTGEFANKIVDGTPLHEVQHKNEVTQRYIQGMAVSDRSIIDTVNTEISLEEYRDFWKQKRESTVTSPYGLHIGHYRSVLGMEYNDILEVHHHLLMMPFRTAMIPERWLRTVQILLEKDCGSPWSHRLRIIELFDSQVNAGLQLIFGKRMVENALKRGEIHPSAYGSVPKRTAQDAVLEKQLSMDLMRIEKVTGAIFDCDAKGCYDRIIPALQTITTRRLGIPRTTALFFARFWRFCHHHVRTKHGISKDSYTGTGSHTLFGIGQGNGAGPAFWLSNLIIMFKVLDKLCTGMRFSSPCGKVKHESTGLGYVDDVTLGTTADTIDTDNDNIKGNTEKEENMVHKEITAIGQSWETMLHTNGGLLELKKCYWIFMCWKWPRGIATLKEVQEIPQTLKITQTEDDLEVTIVHKSVQDAPRVLGCHVAADGSWRRELGRWKAEAARFAERVKKAKFSRSCGSRVYSSLWTSKLRYVASVVCFTKKESEDINRKVVERCLPASGYNRNFPRRVVFGPVKYGGMAWETCASLQITEKVKFFLTHVRRNDKLGKLLQIVTETIQLQSGIIEPVLATKIKWTKWVEPTWLGNLKEGLDQIDGELHTVFHTLKSPRQYDRSLMEIFESWNLTDKELCSLNRCRIYLKVLYVSDIADFTGIKIMPEAVQVRNFRSSIYKWSRQVRPFLTDRKVWMKCLKRLCIYDNVLITTLGRWMCPTHQMWEFMQGEDDGSLLRYLGGVQKKMGMIGRGRYSKYGTIWTEPIMGIPVRCSANLFEYRVMTTVYDKIIIRKNKSIFVCDDKAIQNTMGYVKSRHLQELRERWEEGDSWIMGTDGGLKFGIGTTGVTLHNCTMNKELCLSMSAEECGHDQLHSTREEVRAMVAAEAIISECNLHFGNSQQKIKFICDNKSALGAIKNDENGNHKTVDPLGPDSELLLELNKLRNDNNNISREFQWVKSHVDRDSERMLTEGERINQRADELATMGRNYALEDLIIVQKKQKYLGARVTLAIKGSIVSKDINKCIIMALYGDTLIGYMKGKYGWSDNTFNDINWDACEASINKTYGQRKVAIYKLIHFWQPTNDIVQRNERRSPDKAMCTECGFLDDQMHYMLCRSQYFIEARKFAWKKFNVMMKKYKGEKTFLQMIWVGLQNWIHGEGAQDLPWGNEITEEQYLALKEAYNRQELIGWKHFLVGRVTSHWSNYYAMRLQDNDEKNGRVLAFGRDLVYALWNYTLSVWQSHNETVHGKNNKYSTRDVKSIREFITIIYRDFQHNISEEDQWLFREEERIRLDQSIPQLIGWLERVLICLEEVEAAKNIVLYAKRVLNKMCISSLYD